MKRRNSLRRLMSSVSCNALANGAIIVYPEWVGVRKYTKAGGGGPGVITRMAGAARLEKMINAYLGVT